MKIDPKDYGEKTLKRRELWGLGGWQRKESVFIKRLQ